MLMDEFSVLLRYANYICSLPPGLRVGLFGSTQFHGAESQDFCQAGNKVLLGCLVMVMSNDG